MKYGVTNCDCLGIFHEFVMSFIGSVLLIKWEGGGIKINYNFSEINFFYLVSWRTRELQTVTPLSVYS